CRTAEILVTSNCARRRAASGIFIWLLPICTPAVPPGVVAMASTLGLFCAPTLAPPSGVRPDACTRPDVRLFRLLCALFFSIVFRCSCAGGFSQARAKPWLVIGAHFPL